MSESRASSWISNALLLLVAAGASYMIFSLASENRDLKAQLRALQASPLETSIGAGEAVPGVAMVGVGGDRAGLSDLVQSGGVLAYLTTTCPYCRETLPSWTRLAEAYAARGVPFHGVSLHDIELTTAYAADQQVGWPLWSPEDPYAAGELMVDSVPFTVLVEPGGVVRQVWLGPLAAADVEFLEAALDDLFGAAGPVSSLPDTDPGCCSAAEMSADSVR